MPTQVLLVFRKLLQTPDPFQRTCLLMEFDGERVLPDASDSRPVQRRKRVKHAA